MYLEDRLSLLLSNLLLLLLILMFSMDLDRFYMLLNQELLLLIEELLLLIILKLSFCSNKTTSPELFQRPFGIFPKIHQFWYRHPSLIACDIKTPE